MSLIDPAYLRFTNIAEFGLPGGRMTARYIWTMVKILTVDDRWSPVCATSLTTKKNYAIVVASP